MIRSEIIFNVQVLRQDVDYVSNHWLCRDKMEIMCLESLIIDDIL